MIEGADSGEEIFVAAFTNFHFFFFANTLFLSLLSSRALFVGSTGSGMGTTKSSVTAIGLPCYGVSSMVSGVGSKMSLFGLASIEGFVSIWAIGYGLNMVTEDK